MFFGDSAYQVNDTIHPSELSPESAYIGLEHIEQQTLQLIGIGNPSKVTSNKRIFRKGDILFGKLRPYFRKVIFADFDGICSTDIWVIRPKENIDSKFLYYWCANWKFINFVNSASEGTRMPRAKWEIAINHEIPNHTYENQKIIGNLLGSLDEKIEHNKKTNETIEGIAKALFKSWFIDFDPVRAKAEGCSTGLPHEISNLFPDSFEDSEIGKIPSSWHTKKIEKFGKTICGKTPSTKKASYFGNDFMFVTIPDLHKGLHVTSSSKGLSKSGAELQSKKLLSKGSILVSCIATPGLIGVIQESCFTNQQINSISPNNKNHTWFIAFYLLMNKNLFLSFGGGGSVFFNLNKSKFDSIEILSPPEKIIEQFNNFASPLMDKCFALKREISFLANIRDTILPKLISGKLRIPEVEKISVEI